MRLNPAVHAAMEKWARDDLRSLNAQVEFALRMALKQAGRRVDMDDSAPGGENTGD
ncbi:MAG: hypothetical protein ACKO9Z_13355 [Planctomycetota bacterium]